MNSRLLAIIVAAIVLGSAPASSSPQTSPAKTTYLLIYRAGPAWPPGQAVSELPLREHGRYMLSLYSAGIMKMAGPLTDNTGGAVVFEAENEAEARQVVANDPAVTAGIFIYELHPWAPVQWEKHVKK